MKLLIDNLDGNGPQDYTAYIDASKNIAIARKLNSPATLKVSLVAGAASFVVPILAARIMLV